MALTALSTLYTTLDDIIALLSEDGVDGRLDDDSSGAVADSELAHLTTQAINYATAKVNDYGLGRYEAADLGASWTVNDWATVIATRWLCLRRGNPVPDSIAELFKDVMTDLKALKTGEYSLEDLAERLSSAPAWSNVRVTLHSLRKVRVERPISEGTPPRVAPVVDRTAEWVGPETY